MKKYAAIFGQKYLLSTALLSFFILFYCYTNSFYVNWGGGDSPSWVLSVIKSPIPKFYKLPDFDNTFFRRTADYPLFTILGKCFNHILPGQNAAYKMNTMVAFFGGLTVFMVFLIIKRMTSCFLAALAGALSLLFSHHFWLESNLGEVYTLHFFIVSVLIYNIVQWADTHKDRYLYYIAIFLGLGITHHRLIFLIMPPIFLFFLFEFRNLPRRPGTYALCLFAALAPSLVLNSTMGFLANGSSGLLNSYYNFFKDTCFAGTSSIARNFNIRELFKYFTYLLYQFPIIGFALGFIGMANISKKISLVLFFASFYLLCVLFPSVYSTISIGEVDRPTFYIGSYVLFSIFIGMGFLRVSSWKIFSRDPKIARRFSVGVLVLVVLLPMALYLSMPVLDKWFNLYRGPRNYLKYRDFRRYFFFPPKRGDDSTHRFGAEVFKIAEPNAVIYANYTPQYVLIYYQFLNKNRWDVNIYNFDFPGGAEHMKIFEKKLSGHIYDFPVYVVPYTKLDSLDFGSYYLKSTGPLYQVYPKSGLSPAPASGVKAADAVRPPDFDPDEMVLIPPAALDAEKIFGPEVKNAAEKQQLTLMLKFFEHPFYIDKYEVTAEKYAEFLNAFGNADQLLMGEDEFANIVKIDGKYRPRDDRRDLPANNVTAYGARIYAKWKGKRLPSEIEWERAATNNYSSEYPWGDSAINLRVANYRNDWTNLRFGVYASVYAFPVGDDKWGVRQLIGNVMEWTVKPGFQMTGYMTSQDLITKYPGRKNLFQDGYALKGGSWYSYPHRIAPTNYIDMPPYISHNVYAGFRCAKDYDDKKDKEPAGR